MERPLDGLERRFWVLGRTVSVNVVATAHLLDAPGADDVRAALAAAQARHPRLRLRIDDGPPPRFVDDAPDPPLRVVQRQSPDTWRAVAEDELNTRFASSPGPLLRATLVAGTGASELLLACHHAIGDGFALFDLAGEVLRVAAGEQPGPPLADEPPLSVLVPRGMRGLAGRIAFGREAQRVEAAARRVRAEGLRRDREAPLAERRTRLEQRALDAGATAALADRARHEGTTVQGALSAAGLRAVRADAGRALGLGCQQAVNLRPALSRPAPAAFGLHALGVPTYHHVDAQDLWTLARETRAALGALLDRGTPLAAPAHLEATMPRDAAEAGDAAGRGDRLELAAVAVTNLGRLDDPAAPRLGWERFHFATCVSVGSAMLVATATFRGGLVLNVLTPDPLVAPARAVRLADGMLAELRAGL